MCTVFWKSGNLNLLQPSGPHWACYRTALPFFFLISATTHVESWLSLQFFFHSRRSWACSDHLRSFILLRSFLTSSSHLCLGLPSGRVTYGCHLYIFLTILVSGFLRMCPNQLNLWALTWFITFRCCINLSSSTLVLIFLLPSFFLVGLNILLNILLSNTESFCIIFSLRTHVSHPYTTTGLITGWYNFNLDLLDTSLLWKRALFA